MTEIINQYFSLNRLFQRVIRVLFNMQNYEGNLLDCLTYLFFCMLYYFCRGGSMFKALKRILSARMQFLYLNGLEQEKKEQSVRLAVQGLYFQ